MAGHERLTTPTSWSTSTAQDAVLSKIEWAKLTDSERQLRDAAAIVEMNPTLDHRYVEHWANELGVSDLWRAVSRTE